MISRERKLSLLRQTFDQPGKMLGNNEIAFFCKNHGSRSNRLVGQLSINLLNDKFHCWSCGFSGVNLLRLFDKGSKEWAEYASSLSELNKLSNVATEKKYDKPILPNEFRSLSKEWRSPYFSAAMNYLKTRGLSRREILKWKLGYCEDGYFRNRIIIPSFDDCGELNFFVGRAFYDDIKRYDTGNFSKDIIFNDYMIDWRREITIVEGPFDAFKADDNVVVLQGSELNFGSKLFSKIVLSGVDVLFALDPDVFRKQLDIIEKFMSYGVKCRRVHFVGKKDVGEMTLDEFKKAKDDAIVVSSQADLMKARVLN